MSGNDDLVIGIDGGGTKTSAWIARRQASGEAIIVGRGVAGPSNPNAVGLPQALENLASAVQAARAEANARDGPVAAAVLGLAGSDRAEVRQAIARWVREQRVARRFQIEHDALPVLAAASEEIWGVALISGTGSFAFGRDRGGQITRAGGWGFLLGDEGSGYAIARAGLRAAFLAADGRGPATRLLDDLLARLGCTYPTDIVPAIYRFAPEPAAVAALAPWVFDAAAAGDAVAESIVVRAGADLATMVAAVAGRLGLDEGPFPLAVAGGVLLTHPSLTEAVQSALAGRRIRAFPVVPVPHPAAGAVRLAAHLCAMAPGAGEWFEG